jgi:hypothetical protein
MGQRVYSIPKPRWATGRPELDQDPDFVLLICECGRWCAYVNVILRPVKVICELCTEPLF